MGVSNTGQQPAGYSPLKSAAAQGLLQRATTPGQSSSTPGAGAANGASQLAAALMAAQRAQAIQRQFGNQAPNYQRPATGGLPPSVAPQNVNGAGQLPLTALPGLQVQGMPVAPGMGAPSPQAMPVPQQ